MKNALEFQTHQPGELELIQPVTNRAPFQDLILKHDFTRYKYTIPRGSNSFRLLPALNGSPSWYAPVRTLDHGHGRHAHSGSSVFEVARKWMLQHQPELLYSKANPNGYKLWGSQLMANWVLVEGIDKTKLGILISSAYSGSAQAPTKGLGYQIRQLVSNNPQLLDPDQGFEITIDRCYHKTERYPQTQLGINQTTRSLNECLATLESADLNAVCPIQDTIRYIEFDREWMLLEKLIGKDLSDKIRSATATES